MGGYYARAEGLPDAVADAIRDHYKPVGQGDAVPSAPVTVAVSLADKLDTLASFFAIDEKPTGSKDPFALRRATLSQCSLIQVASLRVSLLSVADRAIQLLVEQQDNVRNRLIQLGEAAFEFAKVENVPLSRNYASALDFEIEQISLEVLAFFADRLKVQQREAGVRHDLIDAVFALGGEDDLVRLLARVHALQAFIGTEDGANLLAGYKRAANILKKEEFAEDAALVLSYTPEPAEKALIDALDAAGPRALAAVGEERFADAMAALATLRGPIDAFFEHVTVNDADPAKRLYRLNLLARFRAAVQAVADFSKIEG
jgi:glycyl-tRNA synthetase beta chain